MIRFLFLLACLLCAAPASAQEDMNIRRIFLGTGAVILDESGGFARAGGSKIVTVPGDSGITTVGTLTGGSIASGFGSINVGGNAITGGPLTGTTIDGTAITGSTSVSTPLLTHSSNLSISPTGDIVLGPGGNDILPNVGYTKNLGALNNKYLTLHAAELVIETLVAQDTIATIGGRILVGPTTQLTADLASGATSMTVKHNQIQSGDRVVMQADGKFEFIAVTGSATGSGPYTYTIARDQDGSGANDWFAGDAVFNTGIAGKGFIDLYSYSGLLSGNGPTIVGNVRLSSNYWDIAPRWAIGNLNGLYGYGSDTYGVALGDNANAWVKIDDTNGIRMGEAGTTYLSIDPSGNATFAGRLTIGTGRNAIANSEFRGENANGTAEYTASASSVPANGPRTGVPGSNPRGSNGYWKLDFYSGTGSPVFKWFCNQSSTFPLHGGACAAYVETGVNPSASSTKLITGPAIAAFPGQRFEFSYYARTANMGTTCTRFLFYDASNSLLSQVTGGTCVSGNSGSASDIVNWNRASNFATAPASTAYVVPTIDMNLTTSANGRLDLTRLFFAEAGVAQTVPSPWSVGGTTLIDGRMLSSDLVLTNTLRSPLATALGTGAGFWLDSTGTPTFRVGDPAGNQIQWDGSNLTLGQGSVALDNTGISINPATTYEDARAYRFTAPTGRLGVYGADGGGTGVGRGINVYSEWTGTGNYPSAQVTASIGAYHTPSSGGSSRRCNTQYSADATQSNMFIDGCLWITTDAVIRGLTGQVTIDELMVQGISSDGTGKVACVRSNGWLGTCSNAPNGSGVCTCG